MVNVSLLWYLLIPLALAVATFFILPLLEPSYDMRRSAIFAGLSFIVAALVLVTAFFVGIGVQTSDTQVLSGEVTSKTREQGHYLRPYDCNCREVCTGFGQNRSCSRQCDTCYEDRYTVTWSCNTTLREYTIQHLDSGSKSVYKSPDPARWTIIKVGDPVAMTRKYTNYVKAAPQSLFRPAAKELKARFGGLVPPYPDNVYDFYKVDRAVTAGVAVPNLREWNDKLAELLKTLGPRKQVNVVIVFAGTADPNFEYALQDAWVGGKKNDVVLILGTPNYPKVEWARVVSWTDRHLLKVRLRDEVQALGTADVDAVLTLLRANISTHFERKPMRDFEYLQDEIDPPGWVLALALSAIWLGFVGVWLGTAWPKVQRWRAARR